MKKINKTLLLASTLFVSQAVSLADNSFADGGYDLNVEPSTSTSLDADSLDEVKPISKDEIDGDLNEESTSINQASEINYEIEQTPALEEVYSNEYNESNELEQTKESEELGQTKESDEVEETDQEKENEISEPSQSEQEASLDQTIEKEDEPSQEEKENQEEDDLVYYDDTNLDNILTMIEDVDQNTKVKEQGSDHLVTEEAQIEKKVYNAPKATGVLVEKDDTTQYYENNKLVKNAQVIVNDKFYNIDSKGNATNPKDYWTVMGKDLYYSDKDGNISRGIKTIKDKKYYFNNDGILQRNKIIVTSQSYYDIGNDGQMKAPKNKWTNINSKIYYNDNNGRLLRGIANVNGKKYYFDNDGVLTVNKKLITENKFYMVDKNGQATNKTNYWFNIGGKTYKTDNKGDIIKGVYTEGKNTYVFADDGILYQDTSIITGGKFYQIDKNGIVNVPKNSWVTYKGKKYHTNANGYVKEGVWKIDNNYYYFTANGLTPNQVVTQKGVIYKVDANGVATKEENNIPGEKSLDKTLEWMFNARANKLTYDMGQGRNTAKAADCSSAVYRSLIYGGFLSKDAWVGNTETLFKMGAKGKVMYEVKENEIQYGDIFVAGTPGGSAGAAGHTGFILNPTDDTIIHMTYSKNGVAVTPRKGYMGDARGLPVKYFRLVGASSSGSYVNKK